MIFDPNSLISSGGLLLIGLIIFAECGLLFGIIFPGDTLLFAAGFFAAQGEFNIVALLSVIIGAGIAGGQVGYILGQRLGPKVFTKKDGIFFRHEYIEQSQTFYKAHGGKTVMLARFVPVIRTFAPVIAGVGQMNKAKFTIYNILGATLWGTSITLAGYIFGNQFPHLADQIELVFLIALPFIFAPPIYHIVRDPKTRERLKAKLGKK